MRVEHQVVINRPPDVVYAYLADPGRLLEWQDGLTEVRRDRQGPATVGERWIEVRKAMGRSMEATVELAEAQPGRLFTVNSVSGPVTFRIQHVLQPVNGGTQIDVVGDGEAGGMARLAGGMVTRQLRSGIENSFARMKEILEAGGGAPPG
jgi:carbon monoxide dehydrogenase subunit G